MLIKWTSKLYFLFCVCSGLSMRCFLFRFFDVVCITWKPESIFKISNVNHQDIEDLDHYEMKEEEPVDGKKSEDDGIEKENLAILEKIRKNQRQDHLNVSHYSVKHMFNEVPRCFGLISHLTSHLGRLCWSLHLLYIECRIEKEDSDNSIHTCERRECDLFSQYSPMYSLFIFL